MKKSARVSEKLVSPGLPGLQVAMRLNVINERDFKAMRKNCSIFSLVSP